MIPVRPEPPANLTERISQPLVIGLRLLFFLLIFYLLLSIAAGLLMPGDVLGRYALLTESGQTCEELQARLKAFNVNGVDYRVVLAETAELAIELDGGSLCWLEIMGVSEAGLGDDAAPLYAAALGKTTGPLSTERAYQPRHGRVETIAIWLLSLLLAALVLAARMRRKGATED